MNRKTGVLWLVLSIMWQPASAFYCGHFVIREGNSKLEVLQKCGEPDYQNSRVEYRSVVLRGSGIYQPGLDLVRQEPVQIDEWTYDFGRHRFMQTLYFENGQLLQIKELGYGTVNGRE